MPNQTRPWLPTSPRETALVFALNLTLMANLTVAALLVSGDLPTLHTATSGGGQAQGTLAAATADRAVEHAGPNESRGSANTPGTGNADERSAVTDAPGQADSQPLNPKSPAESEPAARANESVARNADEQAGAEASSVSSSEASQPEAEDEPVTFFDIPVE